MAETAIHTDNEFSPERTEPVARAVIWIILAWLIVRTILAATFGYSHDESYLVVAARNPAFGYPDHPPLTMWLAWLSSQIFGNESLLVMRLPSLLLFCGTTWLLARTATRLFTPLAGIYAAATFTLSVTFGGYEGILIVTDAPMIFGLALGVDSLVAALITANGRTNWRAWCLAGVGLGIALLSKYNAVLVVPGLLIYFLSSRENRRWLTHPAPYLAGLIAAAILAPNIVWNFLHDGGSFVFQSERGAWGLTPNWTRFTRFTLLLIVSFTPPIWIGLFIALIDGLRRGPRGEGRWLLALLGALPIFYFPLTWLLGEPDARGLHWSSPGYLVLFPLLGGLLAAWSQYARRLINGTLAVVAVLLMMIGTYLVSDQLTDWAYYAGWPSIKHDVDNWYRVEEALAEQGVIDLEKYYVITPNWIDAARASVVFGPEIPVLSLAATSPDKTFSPAPELLEGRDAIVIAVVGRTSTIKDQVAEAFERIEPLGDLSVSKGLPPMIARETFVARGPVKPLR